MPTSSITLTLPGGLAGWLRKCSPVRVTRALEIQGVIVAKPTRDQSLILWVDSMLSPPQAKWEHNHKVSLDLGDATGRVHAAWFCPEGQGYARRNYSQLLQADDPWIYVNGHLYRAKEDCDPSLSLAALVPTLAHLNPSNPRLLPDGSRWVDAEALRLVCLHVAAS